jgi:hypothetical protein
MSQADGNFFTDSNYANIVATLVTINTVSSEAVIRKIIPSGIDSSIYSFQMNDVSSDIYTNLLFALEISGTNFYTYVCGVKPIILVLRFHILMPTITVQFQLLQVFIILIILS